MQCGVPNFSNFRLTIRCFGVRVCVGESHKLDTKFSNALKI